MILECSSMLCWQTSAGSKSCRTSQNRMSWLILELLSSYAYRCDLITFLDCSVLVGCKLLLQAELKHLLVLFRTDGIMQESLNVLLLNQQFYTESESQLVDCSLGFSAATSQWHRVIFTTSWFPRFYSATVFLRSLLWCFGGINQRDSSAHQLAAEH